jgi:hypothetical protein
VWRGGKRKASDETLPWHFPGTIHEIDMQVHGRKEERTEKEEGKRERGGTEIEKGRKKKPKSHLTQHTHLHTPRLAMSWGTWGRLEWEQLVSPLDPRMDEVEDG